MIEVVQERKTGHHSFVDKHPHPNDHAPCLQRHDKSWLFGLYARSIRQHYYHHSAILDKTVGFSKSNWVIFTFLFEYFLIQINSNIFQNVHWTMTVTLLNRFVVGQQLEVSIPILALFIFKLLGRIVFQVIWSMLMTSVQNNYQKWVVSTLHIVSTTMSTRAYRDKMVYF